MTATTRDEPPTERIVLTAIQMEILPLVARGLTDRAIAARLHMSEHGIKSRMKTVLARLGARGRTEAVAIALQRGILAMPAGSTPRVLPAAAPRRQGRPRS